MEKKEVCGVTVYYYSHMEKWLASMFAPNVYMQGAVDQVDADYTHGWGGTPEEAFEKAFDEVLRRKELNLASGTSLGKKFNREIDNYLKRVIEACPEIE